MTNPEIIIFNECMNDTSCIHLYHSAGTAVWQAFGASAYILERIAADRNVARIADYSHRMMMPSVAISTFELQPIRAVCDWDEDKSSSHIILHPDIQINWDNYLPWAKALREVKRK